MKARIRSWGNVCGGEHEIVPVDFRDSLPFTTIASASVLPFGTGRSYGDSCLNTGRAVFETRRLDRLIAFDPEEGLLTCEAGLTLEQLLRFSVPRGYFLPVTLGTKLITVGGAVANDVHGKNHHGAGTFGCHVLDLELARSDGTVRNCSATENPELFRATLGGLGLTGLILSARIRLRKIASSFIDSETVPFRNLGEYLSLARESDEEFEHTSAWADFLSPGRDFGRGVFFRGNFTEITSPDRFRVHRSPRTVPCFAPDWFLSRWWMRGFNAVYFRRHGGGRSRKRIHYDPFFFPLDGIDRWSRLYGRRGFFQYQFVVPPRSAEGAIARVEETMRVSAIRPFLAVLKSFGPKPSPGILSFPMEGMTVALDFPNQGEPSRRLFDRLDEIVASEGGRLYPAKDARMSAGSFQRFFPAWREFETHRDPKFSSDFWRRVMGGGDG